MNRPNTSEFMSFNTQPPEGGWFCLLCNRGGLGGFNTQPPEGGWFLFGVVQVCMCLFQHTAARRRLVLYLLLSANCLRVSTHSRPKAAGT